MAVTIQAVKAGIAIMSGYGYLPGGTTRILRKPGDATFAQYADLAGLIATLRKTLEHYDPPLGSLPRLLLTIAGSLDPRLGEDRTDLAIFRSGASSETRTALFDLAENSMRRGVGQCPSQAGGVFSQPTRIASPGKADSGSIEVSRIGACFHHPIPAKPQPLTKDPLPNPAPHKYAQPRGASNGQGPEPQAPPRTWFRRLPPDRSIHASMSPEGHLKALGASEPALLEVR